MRRQMRRELRPLTDEEGEVRELKREDFREMKPVREVMPDLIDAVKAFKKMGRPKAETTKVHIGFRLAADVVESLKASGPGYNSRVEAALRKAGFGATLAAKKPAREKAKAAKPPAPKLRGETDDDMLKLRAEHGAEEREAPWKKYHAAGAGFHANGSGHTHGFAGAKRSAAKRAAKKSAAKRR